METPSDGAHLHDKATRGEALSTAERARLDAWYAEQDAAEAVIRDRAVLTLTARDTAVLVEVLLNPEPPNEALRAAARRYRDLVESRG